MAQPAVCMLSASFAPTLGGTEQQCQLLGNWLTGAGVPVTVLTRAGGRPTGPQSFSFSVHRLGAGGLGYALLSAIWLAVRGRRFAVLHAHQALSPALAAILAKRLRPRYRVVVKIACSGKWSDFQLARERPLFRRRMALLREVDCFVVLNRESLAELQTLGLGRMPARLLPNGVDVRRFTPAEPAERATLRARLGLPPDEPIVLFVGRLERRKGLDILLAAWGNLACRPGVPRLLVAGPGEMEPWARVAQARGVDRVVTFLGGRADVADLYRAVDLLVLPSRAEGCPNVALEAMASALPVVVTDVAGSREAVGEDGEAGRLVPPEDPAALADAVATLAASPGLRRRIAGAARERILERFDIDRVGARYLSLYQDVLE